MIPLAWRPRWTSGPAAIWVGIVVLAGLLGFWLARGAFRHPGPTACVVVTLDPSGMAKARVAQRLVDALEDTFDYAGGTPLFQAPPTWIWRRGAPPFLEVNLKPARSGDRLAFSGRWRRVDGGRPSEWRLLSLSPLPPKAAIQALAKVLDTPLSRSRLEGWIASDPAAFWATISEERAPSEDFRLRPAGDLNPGAGSLGDVWYASGLRSALWDLPADGRRLWEGARSLSDRNLQHAPDAPAALSEWAHHAIHAGEGRAALSRLLAAFRENPRSPHLAYITSYAARYVGRVDIAVTALDRMEAMDPRERSFLPYQTARLYGGDWQGYAESLASDPGPYWQAYVEIQRGRLDLMHGDRAAAQIHFRKGASASGSHQVGHRLAEGFLAALEGRSTEAIRLFQELDQMRMQRGLFDGELAVLLAEGAVLAGDSHAGQGFLEQAHINGFSCSEWLLKDNLLFPLQGTLRWVALLQRMRDRERCVADLRL